MVSSLACLSRLVDWTSQTDLGLALSPFICLVIVGLSAQPVATTRLALLTLLWGGVFVGKVLPCLCQGCCPQLLASLPWWSNAAPWLFHLYELVLKTFVCFCRKSSILSTSFCLGMPCIKRKNPMSCCK